MEWLFDTLRNYVEIAIFITLALGFWMGRLKLGSFSRGVVTSTLLAGVLVGQIGIDISAHVKSTFLMFLVVSLANLSTDSYEAIGKSVATASARAEDRFAEWKKQGRPSARRAGGKSRGKGKTRSLS